MWTAQRALEVPLSAEEFSSLCAVKSGRVISATHRRRLLELALVEEKTGGLVLTNAGQIRTQGT